MEYLGINLIKYVKDLHNGKLFCKKYQTDPKMYMIIQRDWNTQSNLKKKTKFRRFILFDFRTYYKHIQIKKMWW